MMVTIIHINLYFLCALFLSDARTFLNPSTETSSSSETYNSTLVDSEVMVIDSQNNDWSKVSNKGSQPLTKTAVIVKSPQSCLKFFEFCTNENATYKFETILEGMKSPSISPDQIPKDQYLRTRCQCDLDCHSYGDCCYDKLIIDNTTGEPIQLASDNEIQWECRRVPIKTKNDPNVKVPMEILVVASCPSDYKDDNVIRQCRRHNISSTQYHYSMDVPFLSRITNRTYVNIYCAICNNDTDLYQWNVKLYCPSMVPNCTQKQDSWVYSRGEYKWTIRHNKTRYSIVYDLFIDTFNETYYRMFKARQCRTEVIRDCPPDWPDTEDKALCSAYSLLVKSKTNRLLYKNEHCAKCNGQQHTPSNLECPGARPMVRSTPAPNPQSYAVLMDFYGGGRVGETRKCGSKGKVLCQFGEICDSLRSKCRPYTCGRKYKMNSKGECILDIMEAIGETINGTYKNRTFNTFPVLNQNCPKVFIHRPDYTEFPNNSIYINATSLIYSASEHEFVNETTVLICAINGIYNFGKFSKLQSFLSMIGISISLICLAIHIFIHIFVSQLHNLHGINILSLSCSLFVSQSFFEFGLNVKSSFPLCMTIGMTVHFGFLASFFWMNIMAIDVCRTFATKSYRPGSNEVSKEYKKYSLYAWLTPSIIVLLAVTNDRLAFAPRFQPNYAQPLCWINNRDALLIFFAGPLGLLLLENVVLFLMTIRGIYKMSKITKFARQCSTASGQGIANDRTRIVLYAKLALIMGLTWIFSFIAALSDMEIMWYLFIIFNSLQGAFIFIAFSCKWKLFRLVQVRFNQLCCPKRKATSHKTISNRTQSTNMLSILSTSLQNLHRTKDAVTP